MCGRGGREAKAGQRGPSRARRGAAWWVPAAELGLGVSGRWRAGERGVVPEAGRTGGVQTAVRRRQQGWGGEGTAARQSPAAVSSPAFLFLGLSLAPPPHQCLSPVSVHRSPQQTGHREASLSKNPHSGIEC